MPGLDDRGPSYISSHSADVILSDIRPIKLKIDALNCINVLLDEFLYSILSAARSLSTDKLRAGLLGVLPTSLGKEALLEAEVELRAYWDRTKKGGNVAVEDDSGTFSLQWAFELLRLKCEAYSTLNESDENPGAETRLAEKLAGTGSAPKPSLVAPAALYLTAILEAMCEHILSNVGRVASRDSSRNTAAVNDVFVALCEDDSVYGLFKTMNVYEQIEQLSQAPKPRRSKSFSRGDKLSRASSVHQDQSSGKDSPTPPPVSRNSDVSSGHTSRSSIDRAKSMKKFISSGRTSNDGSGSLHGHKKSESILSDETKNTWAAFTQSDQDNASLQDFDDFMRSDSTMKVSLTPDRLRTMEVYKQEKEQRGNRRPTPLHISSNDSSSSHPSRANGRKPSLAQVDSITEAEEEFASKTVTPAPSHRQRQHSVATPPPPKVVNRNRSSSAAAPHSLIRKSSKSDVFSSTSSPQTQMPPIPTTREFRKEFSNDPFPQKTRRKQVNRESLDLDDVMAGSDAEEDDAAARTTPSTPKRPAVKPKLGGVSASTRELMDFLNEGPPGDSGSGTLSKSGRELVDFLASGPPDSQFITSLPSENGRKGSGRLQRMISKLSLNNSERARAAQGQEDLNRSRNGSSSAFGPPPVVFTPTPPRPHLLTRTSDGSLSTLANRPIPPRPEMLSPPTSPADNSLSSSISRSRQPSQASLRRQHQGVDGDGVSSSDALPASPASSDRAPSGLSSSSKPPRPTQVDTKGTEEGVSGTATPKTPKASTAESSPNPDTVSDIHKPRPTTVRKAATPSPGGAVADTNTVGLSISDVQDMRRMVSRATSPEECRLIVDIFFTKAGIPGVKSDSTECEVPYPSPSPSEGFENRSSVDTSLEISLVELFLGGETKTEQPAPRKKKYSPKRVPTPTGPPTVTIVNVNNVPVPDVSVKA
ncbi:hypothetical protein D9758_014576 [Tetrapyrgos nigripes]|uniref:Uncharacterized protein n=1 Tax=Tetrapyrgos nigripes TaxID=182062 RepID=A0A8H5BYX8_9AGAR|nr:hypothetical protein D9758_014576 [Tetrapyrgos nigripes]